MNWIAKFLKLRVTDLSDAVAPTQIVTVDENGLFSKAPISNAIQDLTVFGNIDGGCANSVYLSTQNITGGSANSVATFRIGGGNALNE